MNSVDQLILVDSDDNEIGYESVAECHHGKLKLHRAFSVFIFNDAGEMLITQRSSKKHTWPLFWSNACCSHPVKGQETAAAARARLITELGIRGVSVDLLFKFEYQAQYDDSWGEHELDWVYRSRCNALGIVNHDEVNDWQFIRIDDLKSQVLSNPGRFTPWFRLCLDRVLAATQV